MQPVFVLTRRIDFPPPELAEDGLLAIGGDLRPERLLLAYRMGIFPWYEKGSPILWHSPDPRCVLPLDRIHVGRSLRKARKKAGFVVTYDTAFRTVIRACKEAPRPGQDGTWITDEMEEAYIQLHEMGFAHSVEVRLPSSGDPASGEIVGGLYGVSLGRLFFGESMFSRVSNASKIALVTLAERLARWGFPFVDAQVMTPHTQALGAEEWPRHVYLEALAREVTAPTRRGSWAVEDPPLEPYAA